METTRKNEFGRILVVVLDPKLIPRVLDVVIGDHYFDLEFEVEKKGFDEKGEEVDVEWDGGEGEGDVEGKRQGPNSDDGLNNDQEKLIDNKRSKGSEGEDKSRDPRSESEAPVNGHVLSKEDFEEFLSWKASKVIDEVVEEVLEDLADKAMKEPDEPMEGATVSLELAGVNSEGMDAGGGLLEVERCAVAPQNKGLGEAAKTFTEEEMEKRCSVMEVVEPDGTKLVGAALIKEVVHSPTRATPRLAGVVAEHTLVRAERLMQTKNLECNKGNIQSDPSCSIPLSIAVDNLWALGLGTGTTNGNSFEWTVQNLVVGALGSEQSGSVLGEGEEDCSDSESVNSDNFEKKALEYLCGDLMEEIFDEDSYHLSSDLMTVQRKPDAKSSRKKASRKLKVKINKIGKK
jgi:hypothetical protein